MIPVNNLVRSVQNERDELSVAVIRAFESGWYVSGPEVAAFEASFAAYVGVSECVGVSNGTDALTLALLALGMSQGSRVAICANAGFYASAAALSIGAEPAFVDVEEDTACMDPASLRSVLPSKIDCVVVTHLYGRFAPMPQIMGICAAAGIPVIEDCAQAAGAMFEDQRAGSWADVGAFSFYPTKNLGALGDAGALTTSSPELAHRIRQLSQYGWSDKYRSELAGGRNSRLDEIQAAVLSARLPGLDAKNERRREILARYEQVARRYGAGDLLNQREGDAAHHAVVISANRDLVRELLRERGVASDIHYPIPDYRQEVLASSMNDIVLQITEQLTAQILTIPVFPELTDDEVTEVAEALDFALYTAQSLIFPRG